MKIEQRTRKTIRIKPSIFQRAKRMARKHGTHVYYLIETQLDQCLAVLERQGKWRRSSGLPSAEPRERSRSRNFRTR